MNVSPAKMNNNPNQKPKLVLITDEFPYSVKEASFLGPELTALSPCFDVTLISKSASKTQVLPVDARIRVLHYDRPHAILHLPFFLLLPFDADFREEVSRIRRERAKMPIKNALLSGYFMIEARFFARFLKMNGFTGGNCDADVFYSYWNNYAAYALTRLSEKGLLGRAKVVSRTHGYDLFDVRQPFLRQPVKQQTDRALKRIYFISEQGKRYYTSRFADAADDSKYRVFRLGAPDEGLAPERTGKGVRFFTLSSTAKVKRLPLLIETLSRIDRLPVSWTHIGGGPELESITSLAEQKLSKKENITYAFTGVLSHEALFAFLKAEPFDCIVNVSESEGLPVSVMEAASLGIPAIALDVGGTREALPEKARFLLPADSTPEEIAVALIAFSALPAEEKRALRAASRALYAERFNAENNSRAFAEELLSLAGE